MQPSSYRCFRWALPAHFLLAALACRSEQESIGPEQSVPAAVLEATKELAERGDARAQFELGLMYSEGEGVLQDHHEAAKWYRLAAEQGFAPAQMSLGLMYIDGRGVSQNILEARKWLRLAADQGALLLDLEAEMNELEDIEDYFREDGIHFSKETGRLYVARRVADFLRSELLGHSE